MISWARSHGHYQNGENNPGFFFFFAVRPDNCMQRVGRHCLRSNTGKQWVELSATCLCLQLDLLGVEHSDPLLFDLLVLVRVYTTSLNKTRRAFVENKATAWMSQVVGSFDAHQATGTSVP